MASSTLTACACACLPSLECCAMLPSKVNTMNPYCKTEELQATRQRCKW